MRTYQVLELVMLSASYQVMTMALQLVLRLSQLMTLAITLSYWY